MSDIQGNKYFADHLVDHTNTGDGRAISAALFAIAYEQRTANLMTFFQDPLLRQHVDDAEFLALEKQLLERLGIRDDN